MAVIIPDTFGDIKRIVYNRARIAGDVQSADQEFVESVINEYYMKIATERSWHWRKFDRVINFKKAVTTGTSSVVNGSREVVITGFTVDETYLDKSIRFGNWTELYRVVGIDEGTNSLALDGNYVGTTDTAATHKIYQYEYPLPPDLDTLDQVFIDTGGFNASAAGGGELDPLNVIEFNQLISTYSSIVDVPAFYTRDGDVPAEALPVLDEEVLDYDFLGGDENERISKIRFFPIDPDRERLIHLNYTLLVEPLTDDDQRPIMPPDNRWILVHYALAEWWSTKGGGGSSDREFKAADSMLAEMRQEYHRTDVKPQIIVNATINRRQHGTNRDRRALLHWISRQQETGGA